MASEYLCNIDDIISAVQKVRVLLYAYHELYGERELYGTMLNDAMVLLECVEQAMDELDVVISEMSGGVSSGRQD